MVDAAAELCHALLQYGIVDAIATNYEDSKAFSAASRAFGAMCAPKRRRFVENAWDTTEFEDVRVNSGGFVYKSSTLRVAQADEDKLFSVARVTGWRTTDSGRHYVATIQRVEKPMFDDVCISTLRWIAITLNGNGFSADESQSFSMRLDRVRFAGLLAPYVVAVYLTSGGNTLTGGRRRPDGSFRLFGEHKTPIPLQDLIFHELVLTLGISDDAPRCEKTDIVLLTPKIEDADLFLFPYARTRDRELDNRDFCYLSDLHCNYLRALIREGMMNNYEPGSYECHRFIDWGDAPGNPDCGITGKRLRELSISARIDKDF